MQRFFRLFFLVFFLFIFSSFFSQNKSIHEYFYSKNKDQSKISDFKYYKLPTNTNNINLTKTVFGFLPDWEYVSQSKQYLRLDLLTHLAVFDFITDEFGNLTSPLSWPWNDIISQAQTTSTKIIITVISFDADVINSILTNQSSRQNLINNIQNIINTYNLDGVIIDFENVTTADRGSNMNTFMSELNSTLATEKEVSFASPAWNWGGWDFEGLANSCDYLFVMEYDFYGEWSDISGPTSPLISNGISISRSISEQYANVAKSKIILGLPYYGIHWETASQNENSTVQRFINYPRYRNVKSGFDWVYKSWSNTFSNSFLTWEENHYHQIWYDSYSSLSEKYDFANDNNLLGIGIWALGFDGERTELWDLINQKFGNGQIPKPEPPITIHTNFSPFILTWESDDENINGSWVYYYQLNTDIDSFYTSSNSVNVDEIIQNENPYYFYVKNSNSGGLSNKSTTVVIADRNSPNILIVDGFDRYYANNNNYDYIEKYAETTRYSLTSANNEAIIRNNIDINSYSTIYWFVGNESRDTESLNYFEKNTLKYYMIIPPGEFGNKHGIFISGSEIGYDLADTANWSTTEDLEFFNSTLLANYIYDSPLNEPNIYYSFSSIGDNIFPLEQNINFDNGNFGSYNVLYPDIISQNYSTNTLKLDNLNENQGTVGISKKYGSETFGARYLFYSTIPFETIRTENERIVFMNAIDDFFDYPISVEDSENIPSKFQLFQNYPNPFSTKSDISETSTTIKFTIPKNVSNIHCQLTIYNSLGQQVAELINKPLTAGNYEVKFDASKLTSGIYFYRLQSSGFVETRKMILMK